MSTLTNESPIGSLGLESGDHWVKFHVDGDRITYEVAASLPAAMVQTTGARKPTGFVQKWSGTARKVEDKGDAWLSHINEKHLR